MDIAPADQAAVDAMWASYVADSGYDGPLVTAVAFGDSAEMADELGLLVLHGPKRATAELVQAFAAQGLSKVASCAQNGIFYRVGYLLANAQRSSTARRYSAWSRRV